MFYSQVVIADGTQDTQSRLPSSITNFLFSQKEKTLTELIQDRWLAYTSEGKIGLGIRSFLDLRSWFRSNDIPSCEVCNEAGIKVLMCDYYDIAFPLFLPLTPYHILYKCFCRISINVVCSDTSIIIFVSTTGINLFQGGMQCENPYLLSEEEISTAEGNSCNTSSIVTHVDVAIIVC